MKKYMLKTDLEIMKVIQQVALCHFTICSSLELLHFIHNSFKRRNGSNRYTHIKITSGKGYSVDTINPAGDNLYTADQICRMVEFLIDNIFVKFGGCLFCQVIGILMGRNCAPLLADLFLYSD